MDGEYQRHQVGGAGEMDQSGAGAMAGASTSNQVTAAAGEGQTFGTVLQSAETQFFEVVNQVGPVAIACIVLAVLVGLILRWIRRGAYAYTRREGRAAADRGPSEYPDYDRGLVSSARIRDDWERWDGDRDGGSAGPDPDRREFGEERTRSWSGSQNEGRFGA